MRHVQIKQCDSVRVTLQRSVFKHLHCFDTLIGAVPTPEQQVEDLRGDEDVEKYLKGALESAENDEQREYLEEMLQEQADPNCPNSLAARAERNRQAAEDMAGGFLSNRVTNTSEVRRLIRRWGRALRERLEELAGAGS